MELALAFQAHLLLMLLVVALELMEHPRQILEMAETHKQLQELVLRALLVLSFFAILQKELSQSAQV
jgi:hypothetical protein